MTRIVIAGAGMIGCYVGGRLLAAGRDVTLLGRAGLAAEIGEHGLTVSDYEGDKARLEDVRFSTAPDCLAGADIVLVAVKSSATQDIAGQIARFAPAATVVSLQNGISNPDILRSVLPRADIRGAVVPFNVVRIGPGRFHRASSGALLIADGPGNLARTLCVPRMQVETTADIEAAQWGKLLVNLNNALNALSGLPLLEQLQDRGWRKLLAAQMDETLAVLFAAGIRPAQFAAAPPRLVPHILRLPSPLFRVISRRMLTIDPAARSSMQDDLRNSRLTEIDALQGEVLRRAGNVGIECPSIQRVVAAIRAAEAAGNGPPALAARDLDGPT